jgi:MoaA/NifB/PqqE/SkfB family radical SAM enzyme
MDQLESVYTLARDMNVDFVFCGIAHNSEIYFGCPNQDIEDRKTFKEQIDCMVKRDLTSPNPKKWLRAYYGMGVTRHAFTGTRNIPCGAGEAFFWMNPFGDIYPDMVLNRKLGNLRENTFEEIWLGEEADKFRKELRTQGCPTPCWMSCTVVPYMKEHLPGAAMWAVRNKICAHLGLPVREPK